MRDRIDVSSYAHSVLMFGEVHMDAEAFGVAVTRRPDACIGNLCASERARLLDVLLHAGRHQMDSIEAPRAFGVWTISSDARDQQPRNLWLAIRRVPGPIFVIELSEI